MKKAIYRCLCKFLAVTVFIMGLITCNPDRTIILATGLVNNLTVNDTANASGWSIGSNLQVGNTQFGDRVYTLTYVPESLLGADWIRAANNSKSYSGNLISFNVTANAYIYVAHSDAIVTKPTWMSDWKDTGENIVNSDNNASFSLYYKYYPAGSNVIMGDNGGTAGNIYTVIASSQKPLVESFSVKDTSNSGVWSVRSNLQAGDEGYPDRTGKTFMSVPASVAGSKWIRTAYNSKNYTNDPIITFVVNADVVVYIAHNVRISAKPSWLAGWENTGEKLINSEDSSGGLTLFKKYYPANSAVSLGNNGSSASSMYTIILSTHIPAFTNLSVNDTTNASGWTTCSNIQSGNVSYGDRTYTFTSIPSDLAGDDWIRTANNSKSYTGNTLVTFEVLDNMYIYVAHNDAITAKPSWLSGWEDSGKDLTTSEPAAYSLFRKYFPAHTLVSLGNNGSTTWNMYTIIAQPTAQQPVINIMSRNFVSIDASSGTAVMTPIPNLVSGDIGCNVKIANNDYTVSSKHATALMALYYKDPVTLYPQLKKVSVVELDIAAGDIQTLTPQLHVSEVNANDFVKVFVWDSPTTLSPYSEPCDLIPAE